MRILRRPRRRFRFTPLLAAILLISSLVSAEAPAVAPVSLEYQIKASFIFNFLQFIEWPQQLQGVPPSTVRLCVAGDNPFGAALDSLDGELVNGMRMNVVRTPVANTADLESCEVIFFSRSLHDRLPGFLHSVRGRSVLTVGESEDFLDSGGIIRFVTRENKVSFEVNRAAANEARLTISSKLLRLAQHVSG